MVEIIKIRSSVFIPEVLWMAPRIDPTSGIQFEFGADAREFSPHTVNTMRSRIEQEVIVDFVKRELFLHCQTGITKAKITYPDGKVEYLSDKASTSGITCQHIDWLPESVRFVMLASASNPLRPNAPTVDYAYDLECFSDGTVSIKGRHDGFPCYEIYKQVDFSEFQLIYQHDFRKTGDTPDALDGPMEYQFASEF
ncbi:DUF3238 domain-containing protein [Bacillus sp. EAC]|uniref:DUF3238 domain-containing protein n=1 Tax=Bacillus sp. EAC TaxID=1978338 RepID=UPI000B44F41F|nr:DUF3238 domain-containing protein [Bacillus sp. EAC]